MLSRKIFCKALNILTLYCSLNVFALSDEIKDPRFEKQLTPAQQLQLENKKAQALASFAKALDALDGQYVDMETVQIDRLLERALTAMLSDLDPHTSYLTPEQFKHFVSSEPKKEQKKIEIKTEDLSHNIVYLKLPLFHANAFHELSQRLEQFKKEHNNQINGLIFDLRDNPGGLFEQSVKISNLFIDSGILVSSIGRDKDQPQQVDFALKSKTIDDFPIVILVNEGTASASEIVAGALQDRKRALIMGTTTYGKGSIQRVVPLANGGAIKLTIARYYTPSGRSIQADGIIPDVQITNQQNIHTKENTKISHLENASNLQSDEDINSWDDTIREDAWIKNAYIYLTKQSDR